MSDLVPFRTGGRTLLLRRAARPRYWGSVPTSPCPVPWENESHLRRVYEDVMVDRARKGMALIGYNACLDILGRMKPSARLHLKWLLSIYGDPRFGGKRAIDHGE